uniref:Uncharacterized protein n=1 Tax=Brassica oleracea TaxID=3712 RepID=A0A3P6H793_BRAOL|nr:unnamed protein product [Brassica oleracea]
MGKMQKNGSGVLMLLYHDMYHDYAEQSHSLLEAYVSHGNDGFSETEPRDHALNGQQVAQTEETQELPCESHPIEELSLENQQVEDTDMTQEKPAEEVAQEAQLVEEKHADDDILVTEVGDETQLIEEMVDNTEPVEQVAQVVEEKHGGSDTQPVEEKHGDTQPVEEMAQAVEPIPEHSKNGDSQSHAIPPQEEAAFTISQEGRLNISHQKKVWFIGLYVLRSFTGGAHCLFPIRSKMSSVEKYCS